MANDCLVTKLKSVVNNNNLLKLGEVLIDSKIASSIDLYSFGVNHTLRNIGNTTITVTTSDIDYSVVPGASQVFNGSTIVSFPANSKFAVDNKYAFIKWYEAGKIFANFTNAYDYLIGVKELQLYSDGNMGIFYKNSLTSVYIFAAVLTNFITGLSGSKNSLEILTKYSYSEADERGVATMAQLGEFTELTLVTVPANQVSGTVEEYVTAQRAAGRTSGSTTFVYPMYLVTYNGQSLADWIAQHSKDRVTVSWDASSITLS